MFQFKFNTGDEVHSTLYNANGIVGLCRVLQDKGGPDETYEVHFRVNGSIMINWIHVGMLEHGHNHSLEP